MDRAKNICIPTNSFLSQWNYTCSFNHKTGEVTSSIHIQFCIANFHESAKIIVLEKMTILRSIILNILHFSGAKSIQEQLVSNRWDLDDSIAQLLKFSF